MRLVLIALVVALFHVAVLAVMVIDGEHWVKLLKVDCVAGCVSVRDSEPIGLGSIGQDPPERLPMVGGEPAPTLIYEPESGRWIPARIETKSP